MQAQKFCAATILALGFVQFASIIPAGIHVEVWCPAATVGRACAAGKHAREKRAAKGVTINGANGLVDCALAAASLWARLFGGDSR